MAVSYNGSRVTISTYKSGTTTANSTTNLQITSGEIAAGDVGRLVAVRPSGTNSGETQVRKITGVSGGTISIHDPWVGTIPAGTTWIVAHNLEDVHAIGDAGLQKIGDLTYRWNGDWDVTSGGFFGDLGKSLEMNSTSSPGWQVDDNCIVQFGILWGGEGSGTQTTEGCRLRFSGGSGQSVYSNDNNRSGNGGVVNYYNCLIHSEGSGWMFQRMNGPTRFIGTNFDGRMGGRFYHEASEWVQCRMSGNDDATPAWSIGATFTRPIDTVFFYRNLMAMKTYQEFGGVLRNVTFEDNTEILSRAGNSGSVFRYIDCTEFGDDDIDRSGGFVHQERSVNVTTTDSTGASLSGVSFRLNNVNDVTQDVAKISDGSGVISETLARRFTFVHNSTTQQSFAPFRIRYRKYGYLWQSLNSAIANPIKQSVAILVDSNVTQSESVAQNHTGISVTDHGGSPVSWNGKSFGITVTGDLSVNSGLSIDDIKHYLHYHLSQTSSFEGKASGLDWHNLCPMSKNETENGDYGGTIKGVRVVDQSGNPFPGFTRMQADDGTYLSFNDINVSDGSVYTQDAPGKFVVDTNSVSSFTIDGFIPSEIEHAGAGSTTILGINNAKLVGTTITATGGTLVLGDGLNPSSNWVEESGSIRTVRLSSGTTETDLLGLRGLEYVDYVQSGATYIYTLNQNTRMVIDGTLTIDADLETLVIEGEATNPGTDAPLYVSSSGVLNVGIEKTGGGNTVYSSGGAIEFTNDATNFFAYDIAYILGTLNWRGGIIRTTGSFTIGDGAYLNVFNGTLLNVSNSHPLQTWQLRCEPSNTTNSERINIFDLTLGGLTYPSRIFTTNSFGQATFRLERGQAQPFTSSAAQPLTFENFDNGSNIDNDISLETPNASNVRTNSIINASARVAVYDPVGDRNGYVEVFREFDVAVTDTSNNPITYSYYAVDIDNGNRGTSANNVNRTADEVYSGQNVNGNITDTVLWETIRNISGTITVDDRTNANDSIPFYLVSYNYGIRSFNPTLIGLNPYSETIQLVDDIIISETDKSVVESYSAIETPPQFYDRAKSYLCDNYSGETSTLVNRSGNEINLGSFDLDIDATASQAFAFDGSKITIHAEAFTGDLVTTGIISLLNGAQHIGVRTDANGTAAPPASFTLTGLKPNSEVRVYESGTQTELAGVENSGTSFTYTYTPSGGFDIDYVIFSTGYQPIRVTGVTLTSSNTSIPVQQIVDRVYNNP